MPYQVQNRQRAVSLFLKKTMRTEGNLHGSQSPENDVFINPEDDNGKTAVACPVSEIREVLTLPE